MTAFDVPEDAVTLNVGGKFFSTTLRTLCSHPDSTLAQMFSSPMAVHRDLRDQTLFIDRNGDVFGLILDYLRTGVLVVPRDPVEYAILRREISYYGLPVAAQLPQQRPLGWEAQPVRFLHARIVVEEVERIVEWEEGALPSDLHTRTILEIVRWFGERGYRVTTDYTSRNTKGMMSIWMVREEKNPGAAVPLEMTDRANLSPARGGGGLQPGQQPPGARNY
jgi:BTB/POZ domain-containing adapter for CUL3-mediated RhoA degradation protein